MFKLLISDDEGHTTVVPLLRDEITIGRHEGNMIRLTERNVSRRHARLLRRNGSYVVEDLGSYNGVMINGERLDGKTELAAGDQLGIGDYSLSFQSDTAVAVRTSAPPAGNSQPAPRIVMVGEPAAGAEFTLNKETLRIGRDERLDIWINHKSISHEHAEIQMLDGRVTIYDLGSANGMRINGIEVSRAVLEAGDVFELGEVRFRFLPTQGAHSLEPLPEGPAIEQMPSPARKPAFALGVLALLLAAGAGAIFVTLKGVPSLGAADAPVRPRTSPEQVVPPPAPPGRPAAEPSVKQESVLQAQEATPSFEPVEAAFDGERLLDRAAHALAKGKLDRAFTIANELPADSTLRETPEFGEIRYRYAQAHLEEARRSLREGNLERAHGEATLVLDLAGVTSKQRLDARRLARRAKKGLGSQNR